MPSKIRSRCARKVGLSLRAVARKRDIVRTEAECLEDMRLGLIGASDKVLTKPDITVSSRQVSIERQSSCEFGDRLRRAVGKE
jgi:hypothetical protein